MTGVALGIGVRSEQRKTRQVMVEEHLVDPRFFVVTVVARNALCALVCIVILMASNALALQFDVKQRIDMAGSTFGGLVSTDEHMPGVDIVVEKYLSPCIADVAGVTTFTEVTFVVVIFLMAADALRVEPIGKGVVAVAIAAAQRGVLSIDRKIGIPGMIEARIVPADRRMAVVTLLAAAPVVGIILFMTAKTG